MPVYNRLYQHIFYLNVLQIVCLAIVSSYADVGKGVKLTKLYPKMFGKIVLSLN